MRILITGSNGLLGQKIVKRCIKNSIEFLATSKGENRNPDCPAKFYEPLDITDSKNIQHVISKFKPTHVIHTAAMTNVDECELNPDLCATINTEAVDKLWSYCKGNEIHFQLLSTDFVFDGIKGDYVEEDTPNPLSVYARSKVNAEQLLQNDANKNWSIVRTIIVYGTGHNLSRGNLIVWALDALPKQAEMKLVQDQFRAPTWADDLAYACVEIAHRKRKGIYHICGPETKSIYTIVSDIADFLQLSKNNLIPISSQILNQPAIRPPKTGFNLTKSRNELDYDPKSIEQTLTLLMGELK